MINTKRLPFVLFCFSAHHAEKIRRLMIFWQESLQNYENGLVLKVNEREVIEF